MLSESEIHNLEKIALDEMHGLCQIDEAKEAFHEVFGLLRNYDVSELHDEEVIGQICEKLEVSPELLAYLDDNLVNDPPPSPEEYFRKCVRVCKEFFRIEKKQH